MLNSVFDRCADVAGGLKNDSWPAGKPATII